jgi:indole-3-glycerol phosphate synthase
VAPTRLQTPATMGFQLMVNAVPDILARIVERKRDELSTARLNFSCLRECALALLAGRRDFRGALLADPPSVIAEIKKASPSRGLLAAEFDPERQAQSYELGGAAAISVLTDEPFFQGKLADLEAARAATRLPALRKDFIIDSVQIVEAAAHGADAILLIAAVLSREEMRRFRLLAAEYGMAALVEVHDEWELDSALESGADIVGVNNRDLRTFQVDLGLSERLGRKIPEGVLRVAESGIDSADAVQRLMACGFHAFLVGEHLMRSGDPAASLRALRTCS